MPILDVLEESGDEIFENADSVGGAPNISRAIQNVELFNANKEEVLKDFAAFDNYVYSLMETEETKTAE